jgi:phospholipase/carboxylesterase
MSEMVCWPDEVMDVSWWNAIDNGHLAWRQIMPTLLALHGSGRDETDLIDFCHRVAPQAQTIAPRGQFAQADGFTFFRRRSDHSINAAEVVNLARNWASREFQPYFPVSGEVIVVGYSSGAIFAEALLSVLPHMFAGAILMRPEPLSPNFSFPVMPAKPILIVAGKQDERRRHDDAAILAEQLSHAGAWVSLNIIDAGHGWARGNADAELARSWLATVATS